LPNQPNPHVKWWDKWPTRDEIPQFIVWQRHLQNYTGSCSGGFISAVLLCRYLLPLLASPLPFAHLFNHW
jgi:hypothetical protein